MDTNFPYEFIGFGAMDCNFLYDFTVFAAMDGSFLYEFIGFRYHLMGWPDQHGHQLQELKSVLQSGSDHRKEQNGFS